MNRGKMTSCSRTPVISARARTTRNMLARTKRRPRIRVRSHCSEALRNAALEASVAAMVGATGLGWRGPLARERAVARRGGGGFANSIRGGDRPPRGGPPAGRGPPASGGRREAGDEARGQEDGVAEADRAVAARG